MGTQSTFIKCVLLMAEQYSVNECQNVWGSCPNPAVRVTPPPHTHRPKNKFSVYVEEKNIHSVFGIVRGSRRTAARCHTCTAKRKKKAQPSFSPQNCRLCALIRRMFLKSFLSRCHNRKFTVKSVLPRKMTLLWAEGLKGTDAFCVKMYSCVTSICCIMIFIQFWSGTL